MDSLEEKDLSQLYSLKLEMENAESKIQNSVLARNLVEANIKNFLLRMHIKYKLDDNQYIDIETGKLISNPIPPKEEEKTND